MPLLSVVIPVYKAENLLDELAVCLCKELEAINSDFEIILVDDGSPDMAWEKIQTLSQKDSRIKGIKLSRNFGQHHAITAGLQQATGKWIVVMDCDLQDQPSEIAKLYQKAQEGYHVVLARRYRRQDSPLKRFVSWLFYKVLSYLTGVKLDESIANFGIYHRDVIRAICQMPESIRYFPMMVQWVGFKQTQINVQHAERKQGKSSYNLPKLLRLALDIILAYSDKPIRLTIKIGFSIAFFAFIFAVITLVRYFVGEIKVLGYTSLIISISFFSGLIILTLGVVGLYVGKTFESVKKRPLFIIEKTANL